MKRYYDEWHFKHPTAQDFKRVMEKEANMELDWYFEQFVETTNTIDYSIEAVTKKEGKTNITLARKGDMPMPIDVVIKLKDGSLKWYYIPMRIMRNNKGKDIYEITRVNKEAWPWVYPEYELVIDEAIENIEAIEIDPSTRMADVDRSNNYYPKDEDDKAVKFEGK
jgi:aminopeptidase N